MKKFGPWLAGGAMMGLVISFCIGLIFAMYLKPLLSEKTPVLDETMVSAMLQTGIANPDVQHILKQQITLYLKSSDGRKQIADVLKSPELRSTVLDLMQDHDFRQAIIENLESAPEMQLLSTLNKILQTDTLDKN